MKQTILLLLLIITLSSEAQYYEWAKLIGSSQNGNTAVGITTDHKGFCYPLGFLDDGMMVSKIDKLGNTEWIINIPESPGTIFPRDIGIDSQRNIYVTGRFGGTIDFDPDTTSFNMTATGVFDAFILKLDSGGGFIWARRIGGTGTATQGFGLDISPVNGHILTTGYVFGDSADFDPDPTSTYYLPVFGNDDAFISEIDASGNFVSALLYGRLGQERGNDIVIDKNGNIISVGNFHGNVDFDPSSSWNLISSAGFADAYINKLDSAGNHIWTVTISGNAQQQAHAVAVDDSGNIYTAGLFDGVTDFDSDTSDFLLNTISSGKQLFLSKIYADGSFAWARQLDVPVSFTTIPIPGWHISLDAMGNLYVTGKFQGTVDFDPGPGLFNLTTVYPGSFETFVLKLNTHGQFNWVQRFENISPGDNSGVASAAFSSGEVVTIGEFDNSVDFDPSAVSQVLSNIGSNQDIYIQKMQLCSPLQTSLITSACDSLVSPSGKYTWFTSGVYSDTLIGVQGCDSILSITLNIETASYSTLTVSECDSLVSPSGNFTWYTSGVYNDTLLNRQGCDSVITVTLNLDYQSQSTFSTSVCGSFLSPSGKYIWNSSGTYTDTLINTKGCDSVITVNLNVDTLDAAVSFQDSIFVAIPSTADSFQWVYCDSNYLPILGATSNMFLPTQNAKYAVIITNGLCLDTSECFEVNGIGLIDFNRADKLILIYPNPTNGLVTIKGDLIKDGAEVLVSDLSGRLLFTKKLSNSVSADLDLGFLKRGEYLLRIETDKFNITKRIVIFH